ncbi:TPA: hypothetical protein ACE6P3_002224, partial [Neisseria gonorrhoeae]
INQAVSDFPRPPGSTRAACLLRVCKAGGVVRSGGNNIPARKFPKPSFWPKVKKRSKISRCRVLPESRHMAGKLRHSRESGNPVRSVSVISDKFLLLFISRFPPARE